MAAALRCAAVRSALLPQVASSHEVANQSRRLGWQQTPLPGLGLGGHDIRTRDSNEGDSISGGFSRQLHCKGRRGVALRAVATAAPSKIDMKQVCGLQIVVYLRYVRSMHISLHFHSDTECAECH